MAVLTAVQQQYEVLPYPPRDPERELDQLRQPSLVELPRVLGVFWGGARHLDGDFRVLDAGCGTGDNTIFLAEQLRGTGAEVVALDFSSASLTIARRRAELRGLDGVRFVEASLEDAPALGLGSFDFIVTTGVLHHLESPAVGLAALRDVLKPDGGLGVMVYARYGREPVYEMQALLRRLAPAALPPVERLRIMRATLAALPPDHRALRPLTDPAQFRGEISTDAGAYDLLLHTQDRPYTVPEVYEWLDGVAMALREFSIPRRYEPSTYLRDGHAERLPQAERHAVAELLHGAMRKHEFYASRAVAPTPPAIASGDGAAVPAWCSWGFGEMLAPALERPGNELRFSFGEERDVTLGGDPLTRRLLGAIDGRRAVAAILEVGAAAAGRPTPGAVSRRWAEAAGALRAAGALALHLPARGGHR
ncbi:MAG: class I SAM-dependent methyltransferase [Dehalococcoidia bacterium]|nr:class I SAM-dependent methyltransferase [Dehalococcoidia bacterium]